MVVAVYISIYREEMVDEFGLDWIGLDGKVVFVDGEGRERKGREGMVWMTVLFGDGSE